MRTVVVHEVQRHRSGTNTGVPQQAKNYLSVLKSAWEDGACSTPAPDGPAPKAGSRVPKPPILLLISCNLFGRGGAASSSTRVTSVKAGLTIFSSASNARDFRVPSMSCTLRADQPPCTSAIRPRRGVLRTPPSAAWGALHPSRINWRNRGFRRPTCFAQNWNDVA